MDDTDPLEARDERLTILRTVDPIAAAICDGHRSVARIADHLKLTEDEIRPHLKRLVKRGDIKGDKYRGKVVYKPESLEMKRLARRSWSQRRSQ